LLQRLGNRFIHGFQFAQLKHPSDLHLTEPLASPPSFVGVNLQSEGATAPYTERLPSCLPAKNLQRRFPVASKGFRMPDVRLFPALRQHVYLILT
jgi:hypothetical protein